VPLALLAVLLLFIWQELAKPLLLSLDYLLQGLIGLLTEIAGLPFATINHPQPSYWALAFAVPGLLLLLAPKGLPNRYLGLFMLLPMLGVEPKKPAIGEMEITMLDVGQVGSHRANRQALAGLRYRREIFYR